MIKMVNETSAYRPADDTVVTVQWWSGFVRPVDAVLILENGRLHTKRPVASRQAEVWFNRASAMLPQHLTDDQARRRLDAAGVTVEQCRSVKCQADLPIGGLWCNKCGRPQPVAMAGDLV